ncbi:MAG TPA: M28 family metallopeptidase [Gemmatimonadaceae bacterium]|nr:M28 family metallopeptidase [Gemmatimonadaceae bacterium]
MSGYRVCRSALAGLSIATVLASCATAQRAETSAPLAAAYRSAANRIIAAALADSAAWNRTAALTDKFGHRLSGSRSLEDALDWIMEEMKRDGLENVHGEPVTVPHWVRGEESATLVRPRSVRLNMLGLGGSIGTPPEGITAPVLVVNSFEDLTARRAEVPGRIVLFDVPFTTYGATVRYRSIGAIEAARHGAVASLIRSVGSYSIQNPHTGGMRYDTAVRRIPGAALSTEDAMMLHRMQRRGEQVVVNLRMGARQLPDAQSRNVIAELRGSEKPDEVVVMGGHIDSWDVGQGAMDDAGGSVATWEALRLIQKLGLRPRRTIRVVLWTNEENGLRGATAYRDAHLGEIDKHVLAIESDNGVFKPSGYYIAGSDAAVETGRQIASLLSSIGATDARRGGPQADVSVLAERGVPAGALIVDGSRYFWFHHSAGDTMDKLDPRHMAECVAALAVLAYVAADMPEKFPRALPGDSSVPRRTPR